MRGMRAAWHSTTRMTQHGAMRMVRHGTMRMACGSAMRMVRHNTMWAGLMRRARMREERMHRFRFATLPDDCRGQMAVELVVLIPVVLIVAAIAANALGYLSECARFDRVAAEAVRVYGVSPGYGEYGASTCNAHVRDAIAKAFEDSQAVTVHVTSRDIGELTGSEVGGQGLVYSLIPSFREYTCTMEYAPPFFSHGVFGMTFPALSHAYVLVVDPYEPSGWM